MESKKRGREGEDIVIPDKKAKIERPIWCDTTLVIGEDRFHVVAGNLMQASPIFTDKLRNRSDAEVKLDQTDSEGFDTFLQFIDMKWKPHSMKERLLVKVYNWVHYYDVMIKEWRQVLFDSMESMDHVLEFLNNELIRQDRALVAHCIESIAYHRLDALSASQLKIIDDLPSPIKSKLLVIMLMKRKAFYLKNNRVIYDIDYLNDDGDWFRATLDLSDHPKAGHITIKNKFVGPSYRIAASGTRC